MLGVSWLTRVRSADLGSTQQLPGGCSRDRSVAHIFQHLTGMAPDTGLVINYENERHEPNLHGHEPRAGALGFCALESLLQCSGGGVEQRVYAERCVEGGHQESVWADVMREVVEVENG